MQKLSKRYILFTVLGILILLGAVTLITYASYATLLTQKEANVITTLSCMEVAIEGQNNSLNLNHAYPLSDLQGNGISPYTFKVKNNCDSYVEYDIVMSVLNTSTLTNEEYIKVSLSGSQKLRSSSLNELEKETSIVISENALSNYILLSNRFDGNLEHTYDFRMWLNADSDSIWDDQTISTKNIEVKLSIVGVTKNKPILLKPATTVLGPESSFLGGPVNRSDVASIKFTSNLTNPEGDNTWDVSQNNNKLIMASFILDEISGKYDITINQPGGVNLNENSSYLFSYLTNLELIDLTNTNSNYINNVAYMFYNSKNDSQTIEIIGLEDLTTSGVLNTSYMFAEFNSPNTILNVSDFDISKVINMNNMFNNVNIKELRLDNWDMPTGNMADMFKNINPLTPIYLKNQQLKDVISYLNIIDLNI